MLTRVHAYGDDALGDHDAVGLAAELRARRVSAAEVVDAAVARTEAVDPHLAAVAAERFELARHEARRPMTGFFAGIPTYAKDNVDLAGLPTQQGTRSYAGRPRTTDGDAVRLLRALGAVPLGKSRLSEFGFSPTADFADDPPVRNPWHPGHTTGASSAGSAALVAAGAVPFAHGNDGGGSLRIPAACCGLVGLKPTRGRTASDAAMREMPLRIVADGVLTRSVRDTAAYLRESEKVFRDLRLPPVGDIHGPGAKRLRVALVVDSIGGRVTDAPTREAVLATAALLEGAGHHVEQVDPPAPESFGDDFLGYWSSLALWLTRTGRRTLDPSFDAARTDALTRGLSRHALRRLPLLPVALARLRASSRRSRRFFTRYDVVIAPTLTHTTPVVGFLDPTLGYETVLARLLDWVAFTPLQNATGDPAIALPAGLTDDGLPIGVQLAAGHGEEATLLEVAYELEQLRPFPRIQDRPTIPRER